MTSRSTVSDEIKIKVDSYNNLGVVRLSEGSVQKAAEYFEKALNLAARSGYSAGEVRAFGNLSICYKSVGQLDKAYEYGKKVFDIYEKENKLLEKCNALGNLGAILFLQGKVTQALDLLTQELACADKLGDREMRSTALGTLGLVNEELGDFKKAVECFEEALDIQREIGDKSKQGTTLLLLGNFFAKHREFDKASKYFQIGLELAQEIGAKTVEANISRSFGNLLTTGESIEELERGIELLQVSVDHSFSIGHPQVHQDKDRVNSLTKHLQARKFMKKMKRKFPRRKKKKQKGDELLEVFIIQGTSSSGSHLGLSEKIDIMARNHLRTQARFATMISQAITSEIPIRNWQVKIQKRQARPFTYALLHEFQTKLKYNAEVEIKIKRNIHSTKELDEYLFITGGVLNAPYAGIRWGVQYYFRFNEVEN